MKDELKIQIKKNGETVKPTERARKKKYTKPSVVYAAPLEAMAATCTGVGGKVSGVCGSPFS